MARTRFAVLGSLTLGLGAAAGLARAFRGVGNDGYGWSDQRSKIFVPAPYTHPEYPAGWKGSRAGAHRRLGRTDWQVSDLVLGTGRISGETGERVARLALERGVNYFDKRWWTRPSAPGAST